MAAEEAQQGHETPRRRGRRGRPPGSRTGTGRTRRKPAAGGDLVSQLNGMVAELIKENRKLRRQVTKLTEKGAAAASKTVERSLRTISRRVEKALTSQPKRRRRTGTASRRRTATRRRKSS